GVIRIRDLGSTNGTFVNGEKVTSKSVTLEEGDEVSFGRFQFTLLYPSTLFERLSGLTLAR
ncbi:MAG: FHA domain-containing protein, partial [Magnetococcales bacterium]|nr:FHA domain-containing protein [Magnetococcales bacterium]